MKLYEYPDELEAIFEQFVDKETGEITEEEEGDFDAALEQLEGARKQKLINIGRMIKTKSALEGMLKTEQDKLAARRKTLNKAIEWLTEYAATSVKPSEEVSDATVCLKWKNTERVVIDDEDDLPKIYTRVKPETREPAKDAIKKAIKKGGTVKGAHIGTFSTLKVT